MLLSGTTVDKAVPPELRDSLSDSYDRHDILLPRWQHAACGDRSADAPSCKAGITSSLSTTEAARPDLAGSTRNKYAFSRRIS